MLDDTEEFRLCTKLSNSRNSESIDIAINVDDDAANDYEDLSGDESSTSSNSINNTDAGSLPESVTAVGEKLNSLTKNVVRVKTNELAFKDIFKIGEKMLHDSKINETRLSSQKRRDREEKALHCDLFHFLSSQGNSLKEDLKKY